MPQDPNDLKSMPLYRDVDRVFNELKAAGLDNDDAISAGDLAAFDQYHYHGTDAVDAAIEELQIESRQRVLDIGSGIGGPARHIAATTGASVVALELQPDLSTTAEALTMRCGLSDQVTHVAGDVLDFVSGDRPFDAIVSWLAFFHIEQRVQLLSRCVNWLKPGGGIFVEDLYARNGFTQQEQRELQTTLYSRYLQSLEAYKSDFESAGFVQVRVDDLSEDWKRYTNDRYLAFCARREWQEETHGVETTRGLEAFYETVARMFARGALGGLRLTAIKMSGQS